MPIERFSEIPFGERDPFVEPVHSRDGRVYVRRYRVGDVDEAFALIDGDRERLSQHGIGVGLYFSDKETLLKSYVESESVKNVRLGIWNGEDNYVGNIKLAIGIHEPHRARFEYYLGKEHEGKGYMTSAVETVRDVAFEKMGITEFRGLVFKGNDRSAAVFQRLGFSELSRNPGSTTFIQNKE